MKSLERGIIVGEKLQDRVTKALNDPRLKEMQAELKTAYEKSPEGFSIVWGMTLSRPAIGQFALRQAKNENWRAAGILFAVAALTDLEGYPARAFGVNTEAGAVADPIADGALRMQMIAGLAPEMPKTAAIVGALEADNLRLNAVIQKGREKPLIPFEAKVGTTAQGIGAVLFCEGKHRNNEAMQSEGKSLMLAGAAMRRHAYGKEYSKIKEGQERVEVKNHRFRRGIGLSLLGSR